ncbi:MAG: radical SAM protein [Oligoflexia bacterium]|nr:radical SAM protein [Oligoflexia bacterium]
MTGPVTTGTSTIKNNRDSMYKKFEDRYTTAKGETRASVPFKGYENLWFNTGTLCNLECKNCYIESSPKNDRLAYITLDDVNKTLKELRNFESRPQMISFTGGEPFLNPHMIDIMKTCLENGYEVLVLTNAFNVIKRVENKLLGLLKEFGDKVHLRISLDHYTKEIHEGERGEKTFDKTMLSIQWLYKSGFNISIAGRSLTSESMDAAQSGYQKLLNSYDINIDLKEKMVIFPEMEKEKEVPEITTECWGILNKTPEQQMCSGERMIVKRKGEDHLRVQACTLLAYQDEFDMGRNLKEAAKEVHLNHPFCAQFCVLGGASCSSAK